MEESEMQKAIKAYEAQGIVTRNECKSIDSRPLSDEILKEMHKRGYYDASIEEANLEGYIDYSRIIYNTKMMDFEEAKEYLVKNVLQEYK